MSTRAVKEYLRSKTKDKCLYCGKKLQLNNPESATYATLEHFIETNSPFNFLREDREFLFLACKKCNNLRGTYHMPPVQFAARRGTPFMELIKSVRNKLHEYVKKEFVSFVIEESIDLSGLRELLRSLKEDANKEEVKVLLPVIETLIHQFKNESHT